MIVKYFVKRAPEGSYNGRHFNSSWGNWYITFTVCRQMHQTVY